MISGRGPEKTSGFELKFDSYYDLDEDDNNHGFDQTSTILLPTSPIIGIKNVIQSMDYGVTRDMVERIQAEVAELKNAYQGDKYIGRLLKMIDSLVRHIKRRKSEAHPESLELLHSVFDCLEDLVLIPEITEESKRKMVKTQTEKFKGIKEELLLHTGGEKAEKPGSDQKQPEPGPGQNFQTGPEFFENIAEDTLSVEDETAEAREVEPQPDTEKIYRPDTEEALMDQAGEFEEIGLEDLDLAGADQEPQPAVTSFEAKSYSHPLESVVSKDTDTDTQIIIQSPAEADQDEIAAEGLAEPEPESARLPDLATENQEHPFESESAEGAQVVLSTFIEESQDVDRLVDAGPSLEAVPSLQGLPARSGQERGDWISTSDLVPRELRSQEPAVVETVSHSEEKDQPEGRDHDLADTQEIEDQKEPEEERAGETLDADVELRIISDKVERLYDKWANIGDDTTTKILSELGIDSEVLQRQDDQALSGPAGQEAGLIDQVAEEEIEPDQAWNFAGFADGEQTGPLGTETVPSVEDSSVIEEPAQEEEFTDQVPEETVFISTPDQDVDQLIGEYDADRLEPGKDDLVWAGPARADEIITDEPTAAYNLEDLDPNVLRVSSRKDVIHDQEERAETESGFQEKPHGDDPSPIISGVSPHEILAFTLEEIKQTIRAEFRALAAELRLWRTTK